MCASTYAHCTSVAKCLKWILQLTNLSRLSWKVVFFSKFECTVKWRILDANLHAAKSKFLIAKRRGCEYEMVAYEELLRLAPSWCDIWVHTIQDRRHCPQPRIHRRYVARLAPDKISHMIPQVYFVTFSDVIMTQVLRAIPPRFRNSTERGPSRW